MQEQKELFDALHYMKMEELKDACDMLSIPNKGTKAVLINRIMEFIKNGTVAKEKSMPAICQAKNHPSQSLAKNALILHGSYKNDLKTRNFFKSLIGPHFHFTAFGIDWLNEQWRKGIPPTYQQFADFWIQETKSRQKEKPQPKPEWAYINFLQRAKKMYPYASKGELLAAWEKLRLEKAKVAQTILKKLAY